MSNLTVLQERSYILLIQSRRNHSIPAFTVLLKKYQQVINYFAHILNYNYFKKDELYQGRFLGLTEAIHRFALKKSIKFPTFAFPRIKERILDWIRKERKYSINIKPTEDYVDDPKESLDSQDLLIFYLDSEIPNTLAYPDDMIFKKEYYLILLETLTKLPLCQKEVIHLFYWQEFRLLEIATALQISRLRVAILASKGLSGFERRCY